MKKAHPLPLSFKLLVYWIPPNHLCFVPPCDPKLLILLCPRKLPCLAAQP